jgi:hypothetical protein
MCSSVGIAAQRYPSVPGSSPGQDAHFFHPVTFGAKRGTVTEYNSEFNLYCYETLRNLGMNFNIVGENDTLQNCSIFSSVGRERYSEGPRFESRSDCTFFSPCGIWKIINKEHKQSCQFINDLVAKCLIDLVLYLSIILL